MKKILFLLLLLLIPFHTLLAHQPNYVADQTSIEVVDPEISKAYYGELTGSSARYTITASEEFELYVNILSPDIEGARLDFSVDIRNQENNSIAKLEANTTEWQRWYEEFAGDWYWQGPEYKQTVPAGTYTIDVTNPDLAGKYVLAIGEIEQFGIGNSVETFDQIIQVKTNTFEKPWYSAFTNKIGGFLFVPLVFIGVLFGIIIAVVIRKRKKRI